ncbi:hypothetical protein QBC47DRAFT_172503 [Echria macrotheca]|uniref:Secreted protein n=1 Tax=Echria macrotheca TaxID=438768 RepID=A0AAJ0BFG0_9PEZI|nr:hypothetical protein QBC47DRAFT_172503 [Echria macrotheca]
MAKRCLRFGIFLGMSLQTAGRWNGEIQNLNVFLMGFSSGSVLRMGSSGGTVMLETWIFYRTACFLCWEKRILKRGVEAEKLGCVRCIFTYYNGGGWFP